jgi:hypothetical protein
MAKHKLELAIENAAHDIADAMGDGAPGMRTKVMCGFMEAALWSAATVAETLSASSWVDPNKDDGWVKKAADERLELPNTMTDKQFRELAELLKLGKDFLEKSLPARLRMQPELADDIDRIVGTVGASAPLLKSEEAPPLPPDTEAADRPELEKPLVTQSDIDNIISPPKREMNIRRDDIKAPDDEFDANIMKKPGLPGDPRLKK